MTAEPRRSDATPEEAEAPYQRDVFSHLVNAGKRYALRRELLRRKKELLELREVTLKPDISPMAMALGEDDVTRNAQPVTARLHSLHQVHEEHVEALRREKLEREDEAYKALPFKPKVTPAGAAKNRRNVTEVMNKWEVNRQRHRAEFQRKALQEELREMRPTPHISAFAARHGHADRPAGQPIEDYLLLKEEERCERQYWRAERHLSATRDSRTAPRSYSASPSTIPGVSKHAATCIRRSRSADTRRLFAGRPLGRRAQLPPEPSFRPSVSAHSARLAERYYGSSSGLVESDVFERLYRPAAPSTARSSRSRSHRPSSDSSRAFTPVLSRASEEMVEAARRQSGGRSTRSDSPGSRLHAEAAERRMKLEAQRRQAAALLPDATFRPRVSEKSEALWREMVRTLEGDPDEQRYRSRTSSGAVVRPADAVREKRAQQAQAYKEEQLERRRAECEAAEMRECTFHPRVTAMARTAGLGDTLAERHARWAQRRDQRVEEQRLLRELDAVAECTFQPSSARRSSSGGGRLGGRGYGSNAVSNVAGLDAFVERQALARRRRDEAEEKLMGRRRSGLLTSTTSSGSDSIAPQRTSRRASLPHRETTHGLGGRPLHPQRTASPPQEAAATRNFDAPTSVFTPHQDPKMHFGASTPYHTPFVGATAAGEERLFRRPQFSSEDSAANPALFFWPSFPRGERDRPSPWRPVPVPGTGAAGKALCGGSRGSRVPVRFPRRSRLGSSSLFREGSSGHNWRDSLQ